MVREGASTVTCPQDKYIHIYEVVNAISQIHVFLFTNSHITLSSKVDESRCCVTNIFGHLELASRNITPEFELIYNTAEEYGLKDLSPEAYADLVER